MTSPQSPGPDHVDRIGDQWARERPDLDTSPMQVIGRLHRLADDLTARLKPVFAAHGLTDGEFDLLCALRRAGEPFELTAGGIADTTMVTTGAVSKRIDRLQGAGWVTREVSAADARTRLIRLTEAGRALVDEAFGAHMANERRLLAGLSSDEQAVLVGLLRKWGRSLER